MLMTVLISPGSGFQIIGLFANRCSIVCQRLMTKTNATERVAAARGRKASEMGRDCLAISRSTENFGSPPHGLEVRF